MKGHEGFVRAILAAPDDITVRLVYADWLEEQGDAISLKQAEFLRVECELDGLPKGDRRRGKLTTRLRELRRLVGDDWWRALDFSRVEHCVSFAFRCPMRWDKLRLTENPEVRQCEACNQAVYYCKTVTEAQRHAVQEHCVALDTRTPRLPHQYLVFVGTHVRMGRVRPTTPRRLRLPERK